MMQRIKQFAQTITYYKFHGYDVFDRLAADDYDIVYKEAV